MKYDTVIIGSGASGMSAALMLAQHGKRVALVERHRSLAPLLRRFERDGWFCDPGLHYVGGLHSSGPLSVILRYLGLQESIQAIPMDPNGYDVVQSGDTDPIRFPVGLRAVRETLADRYPRSRQAITAYVDRIEAIHRKTPFLNFDLHSDALAGKNEIDFSQSLTDFLAAHGAEHSLQEILSRYGSYLYGMDGHECPLAVHAMVVGLLFFSAHTFEHGGDEIVCAFKRELDKHGVEFYLGCPAVGLQVDDNRRLQGVVLSGEQLLECQTCICTIHPRLLSGLFPPHSVRPVFTHRIRDMESTFGVFVVFLGMDAPPPELRRSNYYFQGDGAGPFVDERDLAVMSCGTGNGALKRKSVCLIRPSPNSFKSHVLGGHLEHSTEAYQALKRQEIDRTLAMFNAHFPGQNSQYRVLDAATPRTYESYTGTVHGSAYGLKHSTHQRGVQMLTPIKGFYLAGQSTLVPGLVGALISSILAVSNILGLQRIWDEIQKCR